MSSKKSIFINEEEFDLLPEETIEVEASDILCYDEKETIDPLQNLTDTLSKHPLDGLGLDVPLEKRASEKIIDLSTLSNCPRCHAPLRSAIAISGVESLSFKECPDCGTLINTFKPIKYQAEVAARPERYIMVAGGFGSGKSRGSIEKIISHLTLIPGARVVVAARTYPALEATFIKDFFSLMPMRLLKKKNEMKHEWIFTNGSELLLRSFDDPVKLRGINASLFGLLEASNIMYEGFELAQNRIRNTAALLPKLDSKGEPMFKYDEKSRMLRPIYEHDARKILIETNPDAGWVKKKFLLDSSTVSYYGSAHREGYRMNTKTDPNKFSLVMATDANPYLPENFIEEQTRGKSDAFVRQFFYGSFNFSDGLVYPNIGARIVAPHPLPPEFDESGHRALWYLIGLDYGISDALAIVYAAYSKITKKLYFFDEIYEHGLDVKTATRYHRAKLKLHHITNDKLMMLPLFDGRSYNKRDPKLQTLGDLFNEQGLFFTPSFTFNDARNAKFNGFINDELIEIYSTMDFFIEEATNYKWKMRKDGTFSDEPVDKDNHAINAAEFIVMALPLNLSNFDMSVYLPPGRIHLHNTYENKLTVDDSNRSFNPYQGGNNYDNRHSTRNTNNRYDHRGRPTRANLARIKEAEDDAAGNLFQAFVPKRAQ